LASIKKMQPKEVSPEDYKQLRELMLSSDYQALYPERPFPLLFQGEKISRDIFFLDPLIEYGHLPLGKNPIQDWSYFRYRHLGWWFHYVFFGCGLSGWCACSAEKETLLARLYRLSAALLTAEDSKIVNWFEREHGIQSGQYLISLFRSEIARMITIATENNLIVWGIENEPKALELQQNYINQTLPQIRTDLAWKLPHLSWMHHVWTECFKKEVKAFRRAEAGFNKRLKIRKSESSKRPA
jgi:hypothetical protein